MASALHGFQIRLSRQGDAHRVRLNFHRCRQDLAAADLRHLLRANDHRHLVLGQNAEGRGTILGRKNLVVIAAQSALQCRQHRRLVVDQQ